MRLIDADALKEDFDIAFFNDEDDYKKSLRIIDNAPTVELTEEQAIDKLHETGWLPRHDKEMTERPQGDIRWTDKVFVKSNGDIIDFEGRVVGHINLEDVKGGAE